MADLTEQQKREQAWNEILKTNRIFGFCKPQDPRFPEQKMPNPLQTQLLTAWLDTKYKVFTYSGANRIGKTFIGSAIAICTMAGEWLWDGTKLPISHDKPRKVRYVGQAWESHIKAVVEPYLRYWWPKSRPVQTRKNNQGIDFTWVDQTTGSMLEVMSNVQESAVFEGWEGDLVIYDEPPKRDVRIACARGLVDRGGRELFCMTLLKEAWIHREIIKATDKYGHADKTVFNINGDIFSNVGFGLKKENIEQFGKALNAEEKEARLYGKPSYMSTLAFPMFDREKHIVERFKIPLDALIDISIDFHPTKKWAVVFVATMRNGMKYVCEEINQHGNPKYIAEEIIRVCRQRSYERINSVSIDPLSKGGQGNEIDVFSIVSETLSSRNMYLETASKDKEVGISILNNLLWTENEMPGLFYFRDCGMSTRQTEDLMYDAETGKPAKTDDDFTECLYRIALKDTQWYPENYNKSNNSKAVIL